MVAVYRLTRTDLEWANINAMDVSSTRLLAWPGENTGRSCATKNQPPLVGTFIQATYVYGAARIALPGEFVHPTADIGRKHVPELKPSLGLDYPDDCGGRYGGIEATAARETFRSH